MKTLLLTHSDVRKVLSDMGRVIEVVETAFREKGLGKVQMPVKVYLNFSKYNGDLRAMPSYLESLDIAAVKIVNSHPDNKRLHGLPTVMAVLTLVDPRTGFPLAIMDGTLLTSMRTGAAGGVAAKYLANPKPRIVAMIGAGTQARTQLNALMTVFKTIETVKVYDISQAATRSYIDEMSKQYSGVDFIVAENPSEAVKSADIITTTTPSKSPIVSASAVEEGMHFNCIGADAPGKEELDPEILKRAKIVVDDFEQGIHGGEVNVPISRGIIRREDIYGELGEIIAGLKAGRERENEITVFTSTGLAIQDAVTAKLVYDLAREQNIGMALDIVGV